MDDKRFVCQRCGNFDVGNTPQDCVRCGRNTDMVAVTITKDATNQTVMTLGHPDPRQAHTTDPRRQRPQ